MLVALDLTLVSAETALLNRTPYQMYFVLSEFTTDMPWQRGA